MIEQKGPPNFWMSMSFADQHHRKLFHLITGEDRLPTLKERQQLLHDHPTVAVRFFDKIVKNFLKRLSAILGIKRLFGRYEHQDRGSIHAHILIWITLDPKIHELTDLVGEAEKIKHLQNDLIT